MLIYSRSAIAALNMAKMKEQLKVLNDVATSEKVSVHYILNP